MPKGTISAAEIELVIIDVIHCPLGGNKGERKKPVEETFHFCPQIYLHPKPDLNKSEM